MTITPKVQDWLQVEALDDTHWRLLHEFRYDSAVAGARIIVPAGFETDFASVPRLPLVFLLTGDTAHSAAVVHDYLYTTGIWSKELTDCVFKEAMLATGVAPWRAEIMYLGVKAGGQSAWEGHGNAP